MSILNIAERRRSDGVLLLCDDYRRVDSEDRAFPQEYDFVFERMITGAWPITKAGFIVGDTIVLEYANAKAVYEITGPLRVPLFTLPERPTQEAIDAAVEAGENAPTAATVRWADDGEGGGYFYEEKPNGIHVRLVSQELFDPPPLDSDRRDQLATMTELERNALYAEERRAENAAANMPDPTPEADD